MVGYDTTGAELFVGFYRGSANGEY